MRTNWNSSGRRAVAAWVLTVLALAWTGGQARAGTPTDPSVPAPAVGWTHRVGSPEPPARSDAAMAFDPDTGTTVLFGGHRGTQLLSDTWSWDGASWTERHPAASPPPLSWASMAYDLSAHRLLLFGGIGPDGLASAALWSWDGTSWTSLAPPTGLSGDPPARWGASLVSDPATATVLLFGGFTASGNPLGDTWFWDGAQWIAVTPGEAPPARGEAAGGYDTSHHLVVLFGGRAGSQVLGDTWAWDGQTWSQRNPPAAPSPREDAGMGSLAAGSPALVFGGTAASSRPLGDLWSWDGAAWSPAATSGGPSPRGGAAVSSGPAGQVVLFGGIAGGGALADTWTLSPVTGQATASLPSTPSASSSASSSASPGAPPITTPTATAPSTTAPSATTRAGEAPGSTPATTPSTAPTGDRPAPTPPATAGATASRPAALGVTARSVHVGDQLTVSGAGFRPRSTVTVTFHSAPVVVASVLTDDRGRFSVTVAVPAAADAGPHDFEAQGPAAGGGTTTLSAPVTVTLPGRHHSLALPLAMAAITVVLVAAAGAVLVRAGGLRRKGMG